MSAVKYITGNILTPNTTSQSVLVCHQVNCRGVMGAGLAKQVRQMYPGAYTAYKEKCAEIKQGRGGLGDVQFCYYLSQSRYILADIFGQDGCGLGGGEWPIVKQIIEETLVANGVPVEIWKLPT